MLHPRIVDKERYVLTSLDAFLQTVEELVEDGKAAETNPHVVQQSDVDLIVIQLSIFLLVTFLLIAFQLLVFSSLFTC